MSKMSTKAIEEKNQKEKNNYINDIDWIDDFYNQIKQSEKKPFEIIIENDDYIFNEINQGKS